jgi:chemotaxis protein CheZ
MSRIASSADLAVHVAAAERAISPQPQLDRMQGAVDALLLSWPNENGLYAELKKLARLIESANAEISALRPAEVNGDFIPKATDELDAIVEATAAATHRIMDAADVLTEVTAGLPAQQAQRATDAITSIYEACTFQDITGQRVNKVVNLLHVIEERIALMIRATGHAAPPPPPPPPPPDNPDAALLNGPALPGQGVSQDEIDALLADP